MAAWYSVGLAGQQKFKEMEALRQITSKQSFIRRFKLGPGDKGKVIFLDHPHVWLWEHSKNVDGRWENYTCTLEKETCPLCIMKEKRAQILVATVIDTRKVVSKKGKVYQYQKSLLVMKGKAIRAMMRQFLDDGKIDLTHYAMELERDTDAQSVACGEIFTLGKKISMSTLEAIAKKIEADPKEYLEPYDYFDILAPKSDRELRIIAGMGDPIGSQSEDELDELGLTDSSSKLVEKDLDVFSDGLDEESDENDKLDSDNESSSEESVKEPDDDDLL